MEQGNKTVYIYTNSKALRWDKKAASRWFHLNNAKENALEDNIVAMLEVEAELITNDEVEDSNTAHNFM